MMNHETMVLLGGVLLAFSLLRKRTRLSKRTSGMITLSVFLAEFLVFATGICLFLLGVKEFLT